MRHFGFFYSPDGRTIEVRGVPGPPVGEEGGGVLVVVVVAESEKRRKSTNRIYWPGCRFLGSKRRSRFSWFVEKKARRSNNQNLCSIQAFLDLLAS